jgi:hypothetical protein
MRIGRQGKGGKSGGGKGGKGDPAPGGVPRPARAGRRALALLLSGVALAGAAAPRAAAQGFEVLVSLSADDALPGGPVRDQDLVAHAPGAVAHVAWPSETLSLLAGDGGSGAWPIFGDVDAVHDAGGATADQGLYISLSADEAGFKDGDVLRCGPGGLSVFRSEADLIAASGATDGNVDVDAFQLDADGTILFSFGDNEASAFLSGDDPGVVKDGDVLAWLPGAPTAQVLLTEAQVNAMVTQALGSTSAVSTTDTLSLARDPQTGAVLFSVASPTASDATVFSTALGGSSLEGHAEGDFGFTTAPELDALSVAASHFVALTTSSSKPPAGGSVTLGLSAAEPGVPHFVLAAMGSAPAKPALAGWGGFVLAQDALLAASWGLTTVLLIVPDAAGSGSLGSDVPAGLPPVDVLVQVVAPPWAGLLARGSNPLLLELAQ